MREALASHLGNSMVAEQVGARRQRAVVVRVHPRSRTRWAEPSRPRSSDSRPCSTTSARWPTAKARPSPILWLGAVYLLLWLFPVGRHSRPLCPRASDALARILHARAACTSSASCGWRRSSRLAYYVLFAVVHPLLFDDLYDGAHARRHGRAHGIFHATGALLVFGALLAGVNVVFDYAKVRAVVEDRRSMIGAHRSPAASS